MGYKIQKIYVGSQQVRPKGGGGWQIDLTNTTTTAINNAGWLTTGTVNCYTDGVYTTGLVYKECDLSNANKITIKATGIVPSGNRNRGFHIGIYTSVFDGTQPRVAGEARGETTSGYKGAYINLNRTEVLKTDTYAVSGETSLTFEVDFQTNVLSVSLTNGGNTQSGTYAANMDAFKVSSIRVGGATLSGSSSARLSSLEIIVV